MKEKHIKISLMLTLPAYPKVAEPTKELERVVSEFVARLGEIGDVSNVKTDWLDNYEGI